MRIKFGCETCMGELLRQDNIKIGFYRDGM